MATSSKASDNPPDMPEELLKFLVWLKYPTRKPEECTMNNPQIVALGDRSFGICCK